MNEIVDEMNNEEFRSIFKSELFDKIDKMIEEKKMSIENTILLLKHAGCCIKLKNVFIPSFGKSSLANRFEKMIIKEEKKKEEKNEKLFVDLCECYIFLNGYINSKMRCVCVPCILKAALKKEESEETQKEVEMALLTLSGMGHCFLRKELYLKEITEIIKHQQKHRNLTKLANQSAWLFLIDRFCSDEHIERIAMNELHFVREATKELEELIGCIDWKRKEEEMSKEEANEVLVITGWTKTIKSFFDSCKLWNEEFVELISSIVQEYRTVKDKFREISYWCISSLRNAAGNGFVPVEDLLKRAVDVVLEGMQRQTYNEGMTTECLRFFENVSIKLKEKKEDDKEEEERKATKRKIFEKMEEEGYEDTIASFHKMFNFLNRHFWITVLSLNISDYFVNV
eukprot:MONOS_13066.1-p1 / transcript=MONOS_13066.1 / gene=MONOS_13066 / organism=Monocercomonoides_exilis_PA203 / gene_product=unspecified product / transcript_product=unspecified product / location=Mono_scaffold00774:6197-7450(+) / protein_length=399 / sequence_SO=supercontig / SO=protein_coding / is_pseudo=false